MILFIVHAVTVSGLVALRTPQAATTSSGKTELQIAHEKEMQSRAKTNRAAVFIVVVNETIEPYSHLNDTEKEMVKKLNYYRYQLRSKGFRVNQAVQLMCEVNRAEPDVGNFTVDFHALVSGLDPTAKKLLKGLGFILHDKTEFLPRMRKAIRMVYDLPARDARKKRYIEAISKPGQKITFDANPASLTWNQAEADKIQGRPDSYMTIHKFLMWNMTEYDKILFMDTDACIGKSKTFRRSVERVIFKDYGPFSIGRETAAKQGLISGVMLFEPSKAVFNALMYNTENDYYIPFTNAEQDLFESMFGFQRTESFRRFNKDLKPDALYHQNQKCTNVHRFECDRELYYPGSPPLEVAKLKKPT